MELGPASPLAEAGASEAAPRLQGATSLHSLGAGTNAINPPRSVSSESDICGGDASDTGRSSVPLPLAHKLRLYMDSCPGTNKSQFFYGGLGLMLAVDLLDCAMVLYMVVGHTKFGPDLVARHVAGSFNKADCFNHGQLVALMRPYTSAGAYDGKRLHTWKNGTQDLFSPIDHIMSYRNFLLLADDGGINLTAVDKLPDGFEPFDDTGPVYLDEDLQRECKHAAYRGLRRKVLPELRAYMYKGSARRVCPSAVGWRRTRIFFPHVSEAAVRSVCLRGGRRLTSPGGNSWAG